MATQWNEINFSYTESSTLVTINHVMWLPVTTAWHIPGLWMGEIASRYGWLLWICWISCYQPTRVGPPAWGLGEGLTSPHSKKPPCYKVLHRSLDVDWTYIVEWLLASQGVLWSMLFVNYYKTNELIIGSLSNESSCSGNLNCNQSHGWKWKQRKIFIFPPFYINKLLHW